MVDKIVITGISAITPMGNKLAEITDNLKKGKSCLNYISRYNVNSFPVRHGGIIDEKILNEIVYPFTMDNLHYKMFYYCTKQLYETYKNRYRPERIGCCIGADPHTCSNDEVKALIGQSIDADGNVNFNYPESINGKFDRQCILNFNPGLLFFHTGRDFNINGPTFCNLGTCSASSQAIGDAMNLLKMKEVDLMIAGGVSAKVDPISLTRLCRLEALEASKENIKENSSPFDKKRSGFTMSEGAILFLLERESDAQKRDASIYAEVKGYGAALDGFSITDPHEDSLGMIQAMENALMNAKLNIQDIDYINAHGTGTIKNDVFETLAIKKLFKEYSEKVSISSTKSMHGHLMSAAGSMEVLVSILAIQNKFIPPTINYKNPDPECDLNYTPNFAKDKEITNVLSNSFGLGGQNASLIISKYQ